MVALYAIKPSFKLIQKYYYSSIFAGQLNVAEWYVNIDDEDRRRGYKPELKCTFVHRTIVYTCFIVRVLCYQMEIENCIFGDYSISHLF